LDEEYMASVDQIFVILADWKKRFLPFR